MPDLNNEGFAIMPQAECIAGLKPAFWSDNDGTDGRNGNDTITTESGNGNDQNVGNRCEVFS